MQKSGAACKTPAGTQTRTAKNGTDYIRGVVEFQLPQRARAVPVYAAQNYFALRIEPANFEKPAAARGIRGGIVFGRYYKDRALAEFREAMGKPKLVSMGVKSNAPVKSSAFMDG